MRHNFLDRYGRLNSPIHRMPASIKLAAAFALVIAVLLLPRSQPIYLGGVAVFLVAVAAISRIPWPFLAGRVLLLEPFVIGVAVLALFQPGGWRLFAYLVCKCTVCLLILVLLSNTTPFDRIIRVLKAARVPSLLVTTLSLMYRYLFVLVDESHRMKRAKMSRTFMKRRVHLWRAMAAVAGRLFVRASERAERIYGAMCARGWK